MRKIFVAIAMLGTVGPATAGDFPEPAAASIPVGKMAYRPPGEFLRGESSVGGPMKIVRFDAPLLIMRNQVMIAQYSTCVADNGCQPIDKPGENENLPVTGVNFDDVTDYANWLSRKSGKVWRLPTDEEWAFAARERFFGDPAGEGATLANPSANQVKRYLANAALSEPDPQIYAPGHFGMNSNGLADLSGNIWEWTSTCYQRATLNPDGSAVLATTENCGVRVLEGKHRAYLTFFIRDAKGGGCSIGAAPDHLGFRLVREEGSLERILRWLGGSKSTLGSSHAAR